MEQSRNINTVPMGDRLKRVVRFVSDRLYLTSDEPYRPSAQRDAGKSAAEAAGVQVVIEGLQLAERGHQSPPEAV